MIIGIRRFLFQDGIGANIFVQKNWTLPIEEVGNRAFSTFDSTLSKFDRDSDATMIVLQGEIGEDKVARMLETASQTAIGNLPIAMRKHCHIWSVFANEERLVFSTPPWIKLSIESHKGTLYSLGAEAQAWSRAALEKDDSVLRLGVFSHLLSPAFSFRNARFLRMTSALEASQLASPEGICLNLRSKAA